MLFMVIESFPEGNLAKVGERFREKGRMLPEGVIYQDSWMEVSGTRCFQIMRSENRQLIDEWMARWEDLVEFEVVPVQTSAEFWSSPRT
jgi:Protein of unknown function (DUF3303)